MKLPEIGELNRRVKLIAKSHAPSDSSAGLSASATTVATVWGKVEVQGGVSYYESVNLEETVTHRIYVRYVSGLTRPQDIRHVFRLECEGVSYKVRRTTDVNGAHRFTMFECEEIGNG